VSQRGPRERTPASDGGRRRWGGVEGGGAFALGSPRKSGWGPAGRRPRGKRSVGEKGVRSIGDRVGRAGSLGGVGWRGAPEAPHARTGVARRGQLGDGEGKPASPGLFLVRSWMRRFLGGRAVGAGSEEDGRGLEAGPGCGALVLGSGGLKTWDAESRPSGVGEGCRA